MARQMFIDFEEGYQREKYNQHKEKALSPRDARKLVRTGKIGRHQLEVVTPFMGMPTVYDPERRIVVTQIWHLLDPDGYFKITNLRVKEGYDRDYAILQSKIVSLPYHFTTHSPLTRKLRDYRATRGEADHFGADALIRLREIYLND